MPAPSNQTRISRTALALGRMGWRSTHWWVLGSCLMVAVVILGIVMLRSPNGQIMPLGTGHPSPGGKSESEAERQYWFEVDAEIAKCTTQADFVRLWSGISAGQGIWKSRSPVATLQRFFRAWFAADLDGALKGVALIPEPSLNGLDSVFLRTEALVIGGESRFTEAPEKFFNAAGDLLPETPARSAKKDVARVIAYENPVGLFEYVESKLGQGYEKTDALKVLFGVWAWKDPKEAIGHVGKLSFEEDRRSAFEAMAWRSQNWSPDDISLAEKAGMPGDLLAEAWEFQKTREAYRKKWGVDMPKDAGP